MSNQTKTKKYMELVQYVSDLEDELYALKAELIKMEKGMGKKDF